MRFIKQIWPFLLLASLPFERIPSYDVGLFGHCVTLRLSLVLGVVGIFLFGISTLRNIDYSLKKPYVWLLIYLVAVLGSALVSINSSRSAVAAIATIIVIATSLVMSRVAQNMQLASIYKVIIGTTTVVCVFGIYQFFGDSLGLPSYLTGLRANYVKDVFGFPRIQSTDLEPLFFASYLLAPLLLTAGLLYQDVLSTRKHWAALFGLVLVLTLTLSRGGYWAGLAGAIVIFAFGYKIYGTKQILKISATVVAAVLTAILMIFTTITLFGGGKKNGDQAVSNYVHQSSKVAAGGADSDRIVGRSLAIKAFMERPLLGNGIGSFGSYAQTHRPDLYGSDNSNATVNNEYLEVLAETGVAGLLALTGFVITLIFQAIQAIKNTRDRVLKAWLICLLGLSVAYGVQYYAFSTLYIMHIWVMLGIFMALIESDRRKKPR